MEEWGAGGAEGEGVVGSKYKNMRLIVMGILKCWYLSV